MRFEVFPKDIASPGQSVSSQVALIEVRGLIRGILRGRDAFAQSLIAATFGFDGPPLNVSQIAEKLRCSKSTVRRRLKRTLRSLGSELNARGLKDIVFD